MQVRLDIHNSTSRIQGLTPTQEKELKEILSYDVSDQTRFYQGGHRSPKRYLLDRRGFFATGLYRYVAQYLLKASIPNEVIDHRAPPSKTYPFALKLNYEPYREQREAVIAAIKHGRGTLVAPTGTGKSVIIALLIAEFRLKTLIVVPSLELKRQLSEGLLEAFGTLDNITVQNVDALDPDEAANYDMLVCDEAHHTAADTYRKLNKKAWSGIYYRFFLSATPFRAREAEQLLMESVSGQVIFRLDYQKAVDSGYIVPLEAYYYELPRRPVEGYTWAAVYSELVVNNDYRNRLIAELLKTLNNAGKCTLCLTKEIAHGETLRQLTGAGFAHGNAEDTSDLIKWFSSGQLKTLIGTTGVVGEGVDSRACEYVIIAGLGKSKPAFMQMVGRAVRRFGGKESAKIIIFNDLSHKWSRAHFKAQVKYLQEEYKVVPIKLTLPPA